MKTPQIIHMPEKLSHNQNCQVVITRDFRWNTDKNASSRRNNNIDLDR